jgi:hypothetical protein
MDNMGPGPGPQGGGWVSRLGGSEWGWVEGQVNARIALGLADKHWID